jgi:Undecaprenyl-phosphate glucose phosphotransferase
MSNYGKAYSGATAAGAEEHDTVASTLPPEPFPRGLATRLYPVLTELWQFLDAAAVSVVLYLVTLFRGGSFGNSQHILLIAVTTVLMVIVYSWSDLFYRLRTRSLRQEAIRLLQAWTMVLVLLMAMAYLAQLQHLFPRSFLLTWATLSYCAQLVVHLIVRKFVHLLRRRGYNIRSALLVGCGAPLERHVQLIERNPWLGIQIEGYIAEPEWLTGPVAGSAMRSGSAAAEKSTDNRLGTDASHRQADTAFTGGAVSAPRLLGRLSDIDRLVDALSISEIYVTLPLERSVDAERAMRALINVAVNVNWMPDFSIAHVLSMRSDELDGQPIVLLSDSRIERHGRLVKRAEDLVVSAFMIVLLAPVLAAIACAVKLSSPGPVHFRQVRHGRGGQRFTVWKFRTMRVQTEADKQATRNDDRITPIGRLLRRWSLDELPQLFNVLQGTMSLVGPRPHPVWLNEGHSQVVSKYMQRHRVKPGLTGWAQVNGFRGETDTREKMEQRVNCDLYYITHWSPWLDIKILVRTIGTVLRGDNAY